MAGAKRMRQRETTLAFEAVAIEGGLLSPEWLARVAQLGAGDQSEADYRIPKGLNIRDEIGRYWRIAQAHWADFDTARKAGADARAVTRTFVSWLLRESLGFTSLNDRHPEVIAGREYPLSAAAVDGRVPVVIAPAKIGLDTPSTIFGDGGRRRSAFGLLQEYLNAADSARWGIASDGVTLRIARDNASMTRPAWIEADLARIFTEQRYADFAALWLLVHETRFGRSDESPDDSPLERWRAAGLEQGTRARQHLRRGVQDALVALGQGFLSHSDNLALRKALQDGTLSRTTYFQELLRLVYRLIFLLTIEERGLLHPSEVSEVERSLYAGGYSVSRLRDRSVKRSAHDRFSDLWEATKIVFRGLIAGEPRLGLPALAGIFSASECPTLDVASLENRALLAAMFRLGWLRDESGLARVNWRDMGPEELGSVYESLLELVPQIREDGRTFNFATGSETKGNARKTSGSYYTPDSLVQVLLDNALEPVVSETIAAHPGDATAALLQLSIVDPACGSGHFLLAAARRLAAHVARVEANGTPTPAEYRHAVRQVVSRCIYGVDLNPMAVELCKVSLWMEAVEPGLPLTFLDSHIHHGNALLGTTPELMGDGVPDAAWDPIEGDNKKVAGALKKRNKAAAAGQRGLSSVWSDSATQVQASIVAAVAALDDASDADAASLKQKESQWQKILASDAYRHQRFVADAWCAAFVWPKYDSSLIQAAPTNELWRQIRDRAGEPPTLTVQTTEKLAAEYAFLHWHLAFPQVIARGGFNVVLGNPPWERVKLQEQEFFAARSDEIANAPNAAARKKLIASLCESDPQLWRQWCEASREAEGYSHLIRESGRYPLCAKGDMNTYALFAEHNRTLLRRSGRAGFIVPGGIATDETTKDYFGSIVQSGHLASLFHFENEKKIFPEVHHAFRFALLTLGLGGTTKAADLVFFARDVSELSDEERHFSLAAADFDTLNPNTRTCPTFRSRRDAVINLAVYRRAGVLRRDDDVNGNPWGIRFMTLFHMTNDSGLFCTASDMREQGQSLVGNKFDGPRGPYVPLIEAKMVHHFDHRFGTYEGQTEAEANQGKLPEFTDSMHADPNLFTSPGRWVYAAENERRLSDHWSADWLFGVRGITGSEKQRTVIATAIPRVAVGNSFPLILPRVAAPLVAGLHANLSSFVLDYSARQKVGGANLNFFILEQLPVFAPAVFGEDTQYGLGTTLIDWILPRILELAYTAWDLEAFARDLGYDGPPFRWNPERRFLLRAELDAAFFHLYGLSRDDTAYVMDTFPIVRKNDEKAYGEYRTKRIILEIYDAMSDAGRTGRRFLTRLDPPPADPSVAHPNTRVEVA